MSFKNIITKLFSASLFLSFFYVPLLSFSQNFEPNTVIVKLKKENASLFSNKETISIQNVKITTIYKISPKDNPKSSINTIYKLKISDNRSILEVCRELEKSSLFEYCQPNYTDKILYTPSDPRISSQYTLGIVHAFEAWDIHKGDSTIIIGISDTGIDFNHDDLRDNVAYNTSDPIDGLDNDFDGYIDNFMGWDFGSGDNNPQWNESGTSGNAIHGTFTAGLAGAETNNAVGMASLGFSNKILPIKISDDNGLISTGYESIIYAAEHNCKIINCSWGSTSPHEYGRDVIKYVTEDLGVIVVAAAGNDNNENLFYPASYDNVLSVAASNINDEKWPNSSYNWRVDVSAPGQDVFSTLSNSSYGTSSGTSFSAPIVASALSLIMSFYPDTLSNMQLIEILKTTSDNIDTVGENFNYTHKLGKGRLNLQRALEGNLGASLTYKNFNILKDSSRAHPGDTAIFSGYITNYLTSTHDITVTISSSSEYVEIIDSTLFIANIAENGIISVDDFLLKVYIKENTPNNETIEFDISFNGGAYQNYERRMITIIFPSIELNKNRINTTLFSEGRIGYDYNYIGSGLKLDQNESLLYEMGIVTGSTDINTIANVRSYHDFYATTYLDSISNENKWSAWNTVQNNTITPLSIETKYETFDDSLYQNFFFIHYKIVNTSSLSHNTYYMGMFADWDIFEYYNNYTSIDTNLRLALTHCYSNNEIGGLQLLSDVDWNRYAMDNINNNGNIYSRDGLSRNEFYYALSNSNYFEGVDNNGTDIIDLLSAGPFELETNDTLELTFAILADTSEQKILNSGKIAKELYDSLYNVNIGIQIIDLKNQPRIYPNPSKGNVLLIIDNDQLLNSKVEIYTANGLTVKQFIVEQKRTNFNLNNELKGIYFVKITSKETVSVLKLILE